MSCPKCGANEKHFCPPSLGEPGFYLCECTTTATTTTEPQECDVCGGGGICFNSDGSRPNCPACHPASPALAEAAREVLAYRETAKEASRVHIEMHNQIIALQAEVARLLAAMETDLIYVTSRMDEHPEGYEGACWCRLCCGYATDDGDGK